MPMADSEAPLRFGTAGLRGPMRAGPGGMNVCTVAQATWAVAQLLIGRGRAGATVVVGRDARHNSDEFAIAAAEVFAAQGFSVQLLPDPLPTPVLAYGVRALDAAAGVQITASHNPATDNGYKLYLDAGLQVIPPTDAEIESLIATAPPGKQIPGMPVIPTGTSMVRRYVGRTAGLRRGTDQARIALTPLHGVGGEVAIEVLQAAGFDDLHTVPTQFDPDPDFPTVAFPNPEEPGATDAVLALAAEVDADIAIAFDPDADRCAVGIPTQDGWRMLTGDETGWLLGDYLLAALDPDVAAGCVVASTVVSSRMLAAIAAGYGARHVETLTGFKWLARADAQLPEHTLLFAYEEAIGYCVDPSAVRDKDGIGAAVLVCDLVAGLRAGGSSVPEALDGLARRHGVHLTSAATAHVEDAAQVMTALRRSLPARLGGAGVTTTDLASAPGNLATDALIFTGRAGDASLRLAIRPSGTEPKIKCYTEIRIAATDDLAGARTRAGELATALDADAAKLLQRGPN
jgi:phosphomannomutase